MQSSQQLGAQAPEQAVRAKDARIIREAFIDPAKEDLPAINGGVVGSRGQIAITLRQDAQIRVYDRTGTRLSTIGRKGAGPGEFQTPQAQAWLSDTLWIFDFTLRRHTFVTADGRVLRTESVSSSPATRSLENFVPRARTSDGEWLGTMRPKSATYSGNLFARTVVKTLSNGQSRELMTISPDRRWPFEFTYLPIEAYSPSGNDVVVAGVTDLRKNGEFIHVSRVSSTGDTVYSVRIPYSGVEHTRSTIDAVLQRGIGPDRARTVAAGQIPKVLAPLDGVSIRNDGVVFLTMVDSEVARSVLRISSRGVPTARVRLPARARMLGSFEDRIWLREENEDGVQSLSVYRLACGNVPCD